MLNAFYNLRTKAKVLIGVCTPLAFLLVMGLVNYINVGKLDESSGRVSHTYRVLASSEKLIEAAVNMETGMRGYLLAGNDEFLAPYRTGKAFLASGFEKLRRTVSGYPEQVARLSEAEATLAAWKAEVVEPAIALRAEIGDAKTMNHLARLIQENNGKQFFDTFREQIGQFKTNEELLLEQRKADYERVVSLGFVDAETVVETVKWIDHTYNVLMLADYLLASAVDMETGMRGYLLAGIEEFLEPYKSGSAEFESVVRQLQATVSDNPDQVALAGAMGQTIADWRANVSEPYIALRREIGTAKTMDDMAEFVGEARGKVYFDRFRALMAQFNAEEAARIDSRTADNEATTSATYLMILACAIGSMMLGMVVAWFIGNSIARPLARSSEHLARIAEGDLTLSIEGRQRKDEIGEIARAMEILKENRARAEQLEKESAEARLAREQRAQKVEELTGSFEESISDLVEGLKSSAQTLGQTAGSVSEIAEQTTSQSGSMADVSTATVENIQTVASATEQLTSSILELSEQATRTSTLTNEAAEDVGQAMHQVETLLAASQRIGEVVSMISQIAEQTNLLALNATIESARAGEAGKGFGVVAQEVKELASETSKATQQIAEEVENVQALVREAVEAIERIDVKIKDVDQSSGSIAAAVEEQSATTNEISRSTQESAQHMVNLDVDVTKVGQAARTTGEVATHVLDASGDINERISELTNTIGQFVSNVKAA